MFKNKFNDLYGKDYTEKYFSPGRVNLIGEHIDYNGGNVLPMAIIFGTYGYVAPRDDKKVRMFSENFIDKGVVEFDIDDIKYKEEDDWVNYPKGVFVEILNEGYTIDHGFDIIVYGTIPNGSGLSSSASLEVLIGRIIIEQNNLDIDDVKLAVLCQKAENNFVGVNCGIMDQFIIAAGKKDNALLINTEELTFDYVQADFKGNHLLVINSNKKRGLVDSEYNQRRESCERVLQIAQKEFDVPNLCTLTIEQLNQLTLSDLDYMRAKHVIEENDRVTLSTKYLKEGDFKDFGKLLYASHESLRDLYEVSCDELDFIVQKCRELGALGARMTGAGFGGCAIALLEEFDDERLDQIALEYKGKFNLELEYYLVKSEDKAKLIKE